jgi:energy-coupling factor transporter ATP-binding protein EcfA2
VTAEVSFSYSAGDHRAGELPAGITLIGSELRSTNLERDVRDPHLDALYVGARALDVLDRVANALDDRKRTRAWSFTGPYGSGKSTLANLLDALLGHAPSRYAEARAAVEATSPGLASRLVHGRDAFAPHGFLGAVVTARREPLARTVHRALRAAADRKWKQDLPRAVSDAFAACEAHDVPTAENLLETSAALCGTGHPVLLIIDEFGKSLEYLAAAGDSGSAEGDVFLLQLLAEKGAGRSGLPLFIFTLQHLAFSDYAAHSSPLQTKEWAKVQGRFEDITFVPNLGDAVHLLLRRLDHSAVTGPGHHLIEQQARASAQAWARHALNAVVDISAEMFAGLYPLHPLTVVAAPLLAAQIGQHDRSLTGFLASDEPNTVRRSLETACATQPVQAATIRLPQLYDYFFTSGRTTIMASANASRWLEVDNRLNEAHGLPTEDQDTLKAIGILNLIDADGIMRATPAMIQFALEDPIDASTPGRFSTLQSRLQRLVTDGFLVHRSYSDEYRVWQGSDVNIDARVKENATRIAASDVVGYLGKHLGTVLPAAVVAGAHSQRTGMLRYFRTAISHHGEKFDGPEATSDAADGMMVYHLGTLNMLPVINSELPVLVGTTKDPEAILQAGIALVALEELLHDSTLDHVAAREVQERIADMAQEIGSRLDGGFNPGSEQSVWHLWNRGDDISAAPGEIIRKRSYAALVSYACDKIYRHTPHVRNEMLGRHELTSNAARARRELLTALLRQPDLPVLGFDQNRYTPERAMYHGVLEYLGLHGISEEGTSITTGDTFAVCAVRRPDSRKNASAIAVWEALDKALAGATQPTPIAEINRTLMAPPYGVKAGVVPILMISALILHTEDIALFEDGSYCPRLTPEIVERILSDNGPSRFKVKAAPVGDGQRHFVVTALAAALGIPPAPSRSARNPQLLAITRAMLERITTLSPYARHTRQIGQQAVAIRGVLSVATDPDELVFSAAPRALGFDPVPVHARTDEETAAAYIARLTQSLDELTNADTALRQEVASVIGREFRLPADLAALRCGLTQRLHGFANAPLELPLRGFVTRVLNENLPDEDWLDPIIIRLTNKALGDWTDENVENFQLLVRQMARALDRVSHLYEINHGQSSPAPQDTAAAARPQEIVTRLLTLTTPDGTEARTLIHLPEHARSKAEALAANVMEQAKTQLGADGGRILLAALAERLTADEHDDSQQAKEKL